MPDQKAARTLLRERVQTQILEAILDGSLLPGTRLRDGELTEWLGTSRAPIREALAQLAEVGVVETSPNRFTRVAVVTPRVYAESAAVWAALVTRGLYWGVLAFPEAEVPRLRELSGELRRSDPALFPPGPTLIDHYLALVLRHCENRVLLDNIAVHLPLLQLGVNSFKRYLQVEPIADFFDEIAERCARHDVDGFDASMQRFIDGPGKAYVERPVRADPPADVTRDES